MCCGWLVCASLARHPLCWLYQAWGLLAHAVLCWQGSCQQLMLHGCMFPAASPASPGALHHLMGVLLQVCVSHLPSSILH